MNASFTMIMRTETFSQKFADFQVGNREPSFHLRSHERNPLLLLITNWMITNTTERYLIPCMLHQLGQGSSSHLLCTVLLIHPVDQIHGCTGRIQLTPPAYQCNSQYLHFQETLGLHSYLRKERQITFII